MATVVDALLITMGLDTKGVQKGMQQAQSAISAGVKNIMGLLGPGIAAFGFKSLMDDYVKTADTLGKTADRIGVSITALDSWGMAAQHAGGSSEAFQSSLENLNAGLQNLAANGGKGKLAAPLAALGVSAVDAAGKTKEPIQLLKDLAAVAKDMDKAKFAGLASKLGLDKGTIALLQQGDVEVEKLVKDMEWFAYTEEDATTAAKFGDVVQDLGRAFSKVAAIVMREAVPALTWIAEKVTWLAKLISSNKVVMVATFGGIAAVILTKIIPALKAFGAAWLANPATLVITAIVAAIAGLLLLIDDFLVWMDGGESALGDFWQSWANFFNGIGDLASRAWEWIKQTAEDLWNWLTTAPGEFVDSVGEWFDEVGQTISDAWEEIKASASSAWEGLKALPGELFDSVVQWFDQIVGKASSLGAELLASFKQAFQNVYNAGKQKFQELWDWIVGLFSRIGDAIWGAIKGVGSAIGGVFGKAVEGVKGFFGGEKKGASADAVVRETGAGMASGGGVGEISAGDAISNSTSIDNSSETTITNNITVSEAQPGTGGQVAGDAARGASGTMARNASSTTKGGV